MGVVMVILSKLMMQTMMIRKTILSYSLRYFSANSQKVMLYVIYDAINEAMQIVNQLAIYYCYNQHRSFHYNHNRSNCY